MGYFSCTKLVKSPPSSRIMLRGFPSGNMTVCSTHQRYSSSVSPFQAYTGIPALAIAVIQMFISTQNLKGDKQAFVNNTYQIFRISKLFNLPAAAWSCVEKMLQLDQVISAPSSTKVSIRTAVYDLKQENIIFIQFDRNISLQGNSIINSSICRLIT